MYEWTSDIEDNLDLIRINSSQLSEHHHALFLQKQQRISTMKLPVIVLSVANAYAVTGLRHMVNEDYLSFTSTAVSSLIGFLMLMEYMFQSVGKLESDLLQHKDFHSISQQILHLLSMDRSVRKIDGKLFFENTLAEYKKLAENSEMIKKFNSKSYVKAASELITSNKDILLESGKNEITQYLHDHWNILFHQKLFRIKKKNYSIVQSLPSDISPVSLEKLILSTDVPDPMKFYTNPFHNPFSYEFYTKVRKTGTQEADTKEEKKEEEKEETKEEEIETLERI